MDEISSKSIQEIHRLILGRQISAEALCKYYLNRIKADTHGAFTCVLGQSALDCAQLIDRQISKGKKPGSLAGIPVAVKDNIDTVPAVCAAGLPQFRSYRPKLDAKFVSNLRQNGAVIVGLTATDSGAFGVTTPSVSNPKFSNKTVGGSSGGSGAAVAAELCKFAIGTDTGGSIRIPAACCGIAGFKPSYGTFNLDGIRPLAYSYDHVGPLAASVADLRYVMEALLSTDIDSGKSNRYGPVRIGIPELYFSDASSCIHEMMAEVKDYCEESQMEVHKVDIPLASELIPDHLVLSLTEAALYHIDNFPNEIPNYPKIALNSIRLGESYSSCDYVRAKQATTKTSEKLNRVFDQVDFLILPTLPVSVPMNDAQSVILNNEKIDVLDALIRYTAPFNQFGTPVVVLPWRSARGNHLGSLQLAGPKNSDFQLLEFAQNFELTSIYFRNAI